MLFKYIFVDQIRLELDQVKLRHGFVDRFIPKSIGLSSFSPDKNVILWGETHFQMACNVTSQMPNAAAAVATRKPAAMATDEVWSRIYTSVTRVNEHRCGKPKPRNIICKYL